MLGYRRVSTRRAIVIIFPNTRFLYTRLPFAIRRAMFWKWQVIFLLLTKNATAQRSDSDLNLNVNTSDLFFLRASVTAVSFPPVLSVSSSQLQWRESLNRRDGCYKNTSWRAGRTAWYYEADMFSKYGWLNGSILKTELGAAFGTICWVKWRMTSFYMVSPPTVLL